MGNLSPVASSADWATLRAGAIAAMFSFCAAFVALAMMVRFLEKVSFTPYIIYRLVLGSALLWIAYS